MSDPAPQRNDERRSDLAVMEANEFKNKSRLQRILEAHDNVEDVKSAADEKYVTGQINKQGRDLAVLWAVQRHIRQIYNLLEQHSESCGEDEVDEYLEGDPKNPIGRIECKRWDDIVLVGLDDIQEAPDQYFETWSETVWDRHGGPREETRSESYVVPKQVSLKAYLKAKRFMNEEHDLDIQFEELDDSLPNSGFKEVSNEPGTEVHSEGYEAGMEVADGDD